MRRSFSILLILVFAILPATLALASGADAVNTNDAGPDMMWVTWIGSIAALAFALILALIVLRKQAGNERMKELSRSVQ